MSLAACPSYNANANFRYNLCSSEYSHTARSFRVADVGKIRVSCVENVTYGECKSVAVVINAFLAVPAARLCDKFSDASLSVIRIVLLGEQVVAYGLQRLV